MAARNATTAATPRVGEVIRRLRGAARALRSRPGRAGRDPRVLPRRRRARRVGHIALGRLAQVAGALDHDVASLLGYPLRQGTAPKIEPVTSKRSRGQGVDFAAFRVPGMHLELLVATFQPRTQLDDVVTHAAIDVMYIAPSELVLVDGQDYLLREGECVVWPSRHPHTMRNDSDAPAVAVGFTTETVY